MSKGPQAGRVAEVERRQDRRHQQSGPARRLGVEPLCAKSLGVPRNSDRQENQDAGGELGRRHRQGDGADARRCRRSQELPAEDPPPDGRRRMAEISPQQAADLARAAAGLMRQAADAAQQLCGCGRGGRAGGDRGRHRSVRVPLLDLRARGVRRLLRGVVGDAGAAHAADVGHQCDLLGDRGRRAARRRGGAARQRGRAGRWRARSASSRSSSPR